MGIHSTATLSGGIWKAATCEHCEAQYAYYMTATGRGGRSATPFSPLPDATRKAAADAERDLVRALEDGVGRVWCPECGHYPLGLLPRLRWRATRLYYLLALVPVLAMLVYAGAVQRTEYNGGVLHNMEMNLVSFPFESGAIWFVVVAAVVVAGVYWLSLRYQPNADAATRAGTRAHSDVLSRQKYESHRTSDESLPALTW